MVGGAAAASTVTVVRVEDQHAPALAEFYRQVWDPAATPERVRQARAAAAAANPVVPGEDIPTFLLLQAGRALGHVTTIPTRLSTASGERPAHWLKGLMVLPEHRNGPVGMMVLKEAVRLLADAPLIAMVVQPAPRRLFQALGFADLGPIPNFIKVLRGDRVLSRVDLDALGLPGGRIVRTAQRVGLAHLAGVAANMVLGVWSAVGGRGDRGLAVTVAPDLDRAAGDALWTRVREQLATAPARDGRLLAWRYGPTAAAYRIASIRSSGGGLEGVAVVREPREQGDPRLRGLRIATFSDLLFPPDRPEIGLAAIVAAERIARDHDADAMLCTASHHTLRPLLRRRAFLPLGGNVHFMIRDAAPPLPLSEWWLTRGDSSADEVF